MTERSARRAEPALARRRASSGGCSTATRRTTSWTRAGRVMLTPTLPASTPGIDREVVITGAGDCLELWDRSAWEAYDTDLTARAPDLTAVSWPSCLTCPSTHVPVLAGELIEALDPQPGQIAVDCTLGGGGHARLVAERLGPTGHADRRSTATRSPRRRFAELAAEVAVRARASSAPTSPHGLAAAARRGRRAPTSSTSTSACPRCRSTRASAASPTPTTRRSTCGWTPTRS